MSTRFDLKELQRLFSRPNIEALQNTESAAITGGLNSILSLAQALSVEPKDDGAVNLLSLILQSQPRKPEVITTALNYTTTGLEDIVVATGAVTVSLNATPEIDEIVKVKRNTTAGAVTVSGNGHNIDGDSTFTMLVNYDCYAFVFSGSEWLIV